MPHGEQPGRLFAITRAVAVSSPFFTGLRGTLWVILEIPTAALAPFTARFGCPCPVFGKIA
jgi:hypothetical protein